jgi:hypothetical protein
MMLYQVCSITLWISLIPERLDDWNLDILNRILPLKDIEGEEFDFKGHEFDGFKDLSNDICAMANTAGGYLVLGVDSDTNQKTGYLKGYKKNGFKEGKERSVEIGINNATTSVDPYPSVHYKNIEYDKKFCPVIKVESTNRQKPYLVKGSGVCYIRAGASSSPASRSMVINLLTNYLQRRNSIVRLKAASRDLIEQIHYTSNDVKTSKPRESLSKIKPLILNFFQNAVLEADWLFLENNLYGGHTHDNAIVGGYYSFYNKLERLNLAIDTYNQPINPFSIEYFLQNREDIKNQLKFWHPSGQDAKDAILFLNNIVTRCDKFEGG